MLKKMRGLGVGQLAFNPVRRAAVAAVPQEPGQQFEDRIGESGYCGSSRQTGVTNSEACFDGRVTNVDTLDNERSVGNRTVRW